MIVLYFSRERLHSHLSLFIGINSLWPGYAIQRHRTGLTLAQVMALRLMALNHYLNQCWPIINKVQCDKHNYIKDTPVDDYQNKFEKYGSKISNLSVVNELKVIICQWTVSMNIAVGTRNCPRVNPWSLQWRHNERDGVSNRQPHDCLLSRLFRLISKKTSKLRVTGLCARNSPVTGEFPAQRAGNAENVSIWWRHHVEARTWMIDYIHIKV